jgi:hypothetical protein
MWRGLVVLSGIVLSGVAFADTLSATLGEPLKESAHQVAISVEGGVAYYKVQRVFANGGGRADEASLDIDLPASGGVTGLRIKARDTWYDGDLMEAGEAARLYEKLTGFGPFPAKDPALLQWVWPDKVHLQVFPVLPKSLSTVEYTLTVPTQYRHGRYHLSYPRDAGPGLAAASFSVDRTARFDGQEIAAGRRFTLPPPAEEKPWEGGVARDPHASYVFSSLLVKNGGVIGNASLDLDLQHTYRGDLRVELVTPLGQSIVIHDREGASKNDVKGRFPLALPPGTRAPGLWRLVISDHAPRDVGTLHRWTLNFDQLSFTSEAPLFIPDSPEGVDDRGLVTIDLPAPPIDTVDARLGRVVASPRHGFVRLDVDAAPELRPLPRKASVVFVIDASYSQGEEGVARQLAVARAYLSWVPDAEYEIVACRRRAQRLFGRFESAARFDVKPPALGNGSELQTGVAAAVAALEGRPGPRRVVVLSDAALRTTFSTAEVAPIPSDMILHVALADPGSAEERRDDAHALSPVARAGHGILLHLSPGEDARQVVLGLVRPIRIDHFRASRSPQARGSDSPRSARLADDFRVPGLSVREVLPEGESVRVMTALADPPRTVTLEGELWAEPWRRELAPGEAFSKATAAFVFSEHQYTDLDPREQMVVAMRGQVVSPVTSYIAIEPGTRPSRIGLRGAGGGSGSGYGAGRGALAARMVVSPLRPDVRALVAPAIERCKQLHGAGPLALEIETTWDEIVDVILKEGAGALGECAVEAVWAARLPPGTRSFARDRYPLRF